MLILWYEVQHPHKTLYFHFFSFIHFRLFSIETALKTTKYQVNHYDDGDTTKGEF